MATFVLVHGAFYGGWCWRHVRALLEEAGHQVVTPTLTGAGERAHLLTRDLTLAVHVQDVVNVLHFEELREVILVGHSYGGMVITGVADRMAERISQLVYLDAHVPDSGQAANGAFATGTAEMLQAMSQGEGDSWLLPPLPPSATGITRAEDIAWITPKRVSHPLRTLNEPLVLVHPDLTLPRSYIRCAQRAGLIETFGVDPLLPFVEKARTRGFRFQEIDSGHDPMIYAPKLAADALLALVP